MDKRKREKLIEEGAKLMALEKELKSRKYLKDLILFNQKILQVEEGRSNVPLADFHRELCTFVMDEETNKKLILVPRGHLKSTLVTIGYSLLRIAQDPEVRILIANATYDMACSFLGQIKRHLRDNEVFKDYYGDLATRADKWAENMITVPKYKPFTKKEATVTAYGIGGNLVSQHYDVIIADDVVNRDYINTREQIEKTILFYKDSLDLLEPNGTFIVIGTRWHDADLYGWILDKSNPEQVYKNFTLFHRKAFRGDLETEERLDLLWPDKFNRKVLKTLKTEKGPYEFSCTPAGTKILMSDWSYKNVEDVKKDDAVVGFKSVDGGRRQYVPSKVLANGSRDAQVNEIRLESGKRVYCTPDHKWFTGRGEQGTHQVYSEAGRVKSLQFGFEPVEKLPEGKEYLAGWLGGMFDADGSVSSTLIFTQSEEKHPEICREIERVLGELDFKYKTYRGPSRPGIVGISILGGRSAAIRFLNWCKPVKSKRIIEYLYSRGKRLSVPDKILNISPIYNSRKVYSMQTETGNYVADSYLSKNCQYMNDPIPQERAKFKLEWMKQVLEDELKVRELNFFTMVDPAIGQRKSSDKTAIVTIAVDEYNNWFIVNIIWDRLLPNQIIDHIFWNWEQYKPKRIGIELTAYQKSLQYSLQDAMRSRNIFLPVVELKAERSKEERIEGLIPRYANGTIYHLQQCNHREALEDELVRFPVGKHDDIIDALAYGLQISHQSRKKPIGRQRGSSRYKYIY